MKMAGRDDGPAERWRIPGAPAKDSEVVTLQRRSFSQLAGVAWQQLDVTGTFLFTVGCTLILLPLSLAATRPQSWHDRTFLQSRV
jgi:hypothetical protein